MRFSLSLGAVTILATSFAFGQPAPDPVQIGLSDTLFAGISEKTVTEMSQSFNDLVKDLTDMNSKVYTKDSAFTLAKKLEDKTYHLGVFQGYEYAWIKEKHPDLKPLMLVIYHDPKITAKIVVRKDNDVKDLAGLKGQIFAIPEGAKGPSKLFVERQIAKLGGDPKTFFKKIDKPEDIESALDAVCGKEKDAPQATVVDNVAWKTYERIKPGCYKALRVLQDSEVFPTNVVVYREGVLSKATLEKFKQGMLKAHEKPAGKQQMRVFKVTGFENVTNEYAKTVAAFRKAYPPPGENKK